MDKSKWEYKKLGDICEIVTGSTPKTNVSSYWGGGNYWVTPAELDDRVYIDRTERTISDEALSHSKLTLMPVGTVLLSSRAPIGKVAITKVPMYCNQGFKNLVCSESIYNKYLYWFLKINTDYLNSLGRGATFKEISKSIVSNIKIMLPPLSDQRRIVTELDQLSAIISLKQQQMKEYDALAQSLFYEMFGDPTDNEKSWNVVSLKDVSKEKLTYGSGASATTFDGEVRYIRITDITNDGTLVESKVSPNKQEEKYLLHDGDVLFARSGATVGKTYLYSQNDGKAIYAGYLIRLIPNKEIVLPLYVFYYTKTQYYLNFISKAQRAVAQPNINAKQYGGLRIPLPPLSLQRSFAEKVKAIEHQKSLLKQSIAETQTLLDSRMQEYFG